MIVIRIHGWHPERAWTKYSSYHPDDLPRRLSSLTDLDRGAIKHVVEEIRDQTCREIRLAKVTDPYGATSLRSFLESLGAETSVEEDSA